MENKVQDVGKNVTLIKIHYLKKESTRKTLMVFYRLKCFITNGLEGCGIPFDLEFLRHLIEVVRGFEFSPNRKNYRHKNFQDVQGY